MRLVLDLLVQNPDELPPVARLADRHPDLAMVLDHCGKPDIRGGRFKPWAADIKALAAHANVAGKMSGLLNQAPPAASAATYRPFVEHVLEVFGAERTMWASDWPPLLLAGDSDRWWETTGELLERLSPDQRAAGAGPHRDADLRPAHGEEHRMSRPSRVPRAAA